MVHRPENSTPSGTIDDSAGDQSPYAICTCGDKPVVSGESVNNLKSIVNFSGAGMKP